MTEPQTSSPSANPEIQQDIEAAYNTSPQSKSKAEDLGLNS